ncbi:MAG: cobalamin-dependent protein [Thermodesulfobacteriota bacterium]|nr:cobalamin-dependent protein [Thermodesulfobacteriota bacterium]
MTERKIRILLGKVGLDGHDRGVRMIAAWLRDAGMEVVYIGTHNTPERTIAIAIEEDVNIIGLSFQGADHIPLLKEVTDNIRKKDLTDVLLIVGGNIPKKDIQTLKEMGVHEVFPVGAMMHSIVDYINQNMPT